MMAIFATFLGAIQTAIFASYFHEDIGKMCSCGLDVVKYWCQDDCFNAPMLCKSCILDVHRHLPFHRLQQWQGTHFCRTSLLDLGGTIYLGHQGQRCPNLSNSLSQGRLIVVTHTNSIHTLRIDFCHCHGAASEHLQLIQARLFPATITKPESAFTFGVLKEFHIHNLTSKKPLYDYFDALRRLTNNVFPQNVPVSISAAL
jgi:hypothetical protein